MRAVSAIVPAAGLSSRFGGPNKLLQPWGDTTIVGSVVGTLLSCGLDVVVVTGRDAAEVSVAVQPARTVFNPRFAEGLGTSIAAGVSCAENADGFLITLGDMPDLRTSVVLSLLREFESQDRDIILAPVYEAEPGRPGHPVLFGSAHGVALSSLTGDEGARSVLRANPGKLKLVPVDGEFGDIDTGPEGQAT